MLNIAPALAPLPSRSIQQSAATALGRLANHSDELAEAIVTNDILPQLVRAAFCSFCCMMHNNNNKGYLSHSITAIDACGPYANTRMSLAVSNPTRTKKHPKRAHAQVYSLASQNRFYKQAASSCLRAVAKHSPALAQAVVDSGALAGLVACLEEFDPGVKVCVRRRLRVRDAHLGGAFGRVGVA
jgi:hypothetical protein